MHVIIHLIRNYEFSVGMLIVTLCLIPITYLFFDKKSRFGKVSISGIVLTLDIFVIYIYAREFLYWGMLMWEFVLWALLSLLIMNVSAVVFLRMKTNNKKQLYYLYWIFALSFLVFGVYFLMPEAIQPLLFRR